MKGLRVFSLCCSLLVLAGCGIRRQPESGQGAQMPYVAGDLRVSLAEKAYEEVWNGKYDASVPSSFSPCYRYERKQEDGTLLRYSSEVEEAKKISLKLPEGLQPTDFAALDAVADDRVAIRFRADVERVVLFDAEGNVLWEKSMGRSFDYPGDALWRCDSEGNQLLWMPGTKELAAVDGTGAQIGFVKCSENEELVSLLHDDAGNLLYALADYSGENGVRLFRYDFARKDGVEIARYRSLDSRFYSMREGKLLFTTGSGLLQGAPGGESAVQLLDFALEAVKVPEHVLVNGRNGGINQISLYEKGENGETVYGYSDEEQPGADQIRVCAFGHKNAYVAEQAAALKRERGIMFVYESMGMSGDVDSRNAAWNRLMAEFAAGKGPDVCIFWITDWDKALALYESGALAELTDMVADETKEEIFRGVLDVGTVDGKLIGLGTYGTFSFCITSDVFGLGEHYTAKDVLERMEALEDEEAPVGLYYRSDGVIGMDACSYPGSNLSALVLEELPDSGFIDFDRRTCDFDNPEFARILELCRRYGERSARDKVPYREMGERLREGSVLGYRDAIISQDQVLQAYNLCSDAANMTAYPNQKRGRGHWAGMSLAVVNAKSPHMEEIRELFRVLWSYEGQKTVKNYLPVRRDLTRDIAAYYETAVAYGYVSGYETDAFQRADGTGYGEDYLGLMENAPGSSGKYEAVKEIIKEEAEVYFNGGKPVEEVCRIIQNRVQLYLKE